MSTLPNVEPVNRNIDDQIQHKVNTKTKPLGALGKIETLAAQLARIQQSLKPTANTCTLMIFAADHGVASTGVSAFPAEVTRQMVLNFLSGGAAANVFAKSNQVKLVVVDAGVAGDPIQHEALLDRRIASGTQNFIEQSAMSLVQMNNAIQNGITLGLETEGDALAFGEMGIGNTSSAAMLTHKILNVDLQQIIGLGTGLDDEGLANKQRLLKQASKRIETPLSAERALQEFGGFEIASMVGAMIGAAASSRLLIIDGYISTAAALVAIQLRPEVRDYCVFAHQSAEQGHKIMLDALAAQGLLDLDLRLGEGTGALLAWPLIQCAAAMMSDMASFEDAAVSSGPI